MSTLDSKYKALESHESPKEKEDSKSTLISYREAIKLAIREVLQRDERVFLMGEDVGRYGGAFAVSKGLLQEFGSERILDVPLSESGFVGAGIGAAIAGLRPIVEVMTINFSLLCMDQIVNNAATLLHMSGGQVNVPLVIRMSTGLGRQLAAQHSHSWEPLYAHIPGLRVLSIGTIEDARGMLLTAIQHPDPVIIFEYTSMLNVEDELPANSGAVNIDKAEIKVKGSDISIITYGAAVHKAVSAAKELKEMGIEAEIINLRVLRPLDNETIFNSVKKTHKVLLVEDAWGSVNISAEVNARIVENAFYDLDIPIQRLGGVEVPMPYPRHLEEACVPQKDDIINKVKKMLQHD